ncbi:MAG: AraC family transcriptional regulator [Bacteroidales bacterium]|nr:AraC family transcriptional regulator [Bacteroidales bacterium]
MITDYSNTSFFILRMNTSGSAKSTEDSVTRLPLVGFIYLTDGEVLADVDGTPFLCQPGQVLLIPSDRPFTIRYYSDAIGFKGGFSPSTVSDTAALRFLSEPIHQGFWFEEAAFMGMLFSMLESAFQKGERAFIEKGLDLFLTRVKPGRGAVFHPAVTAFLESVFNSEKQPGTIARYASENGISQNYLSRLVKNATGRSVGAWIDIVRIQRTKRLLTSTSLPIIDIAASVGIEDQSYFSRLFKKETGLTPTSFRKKMQG